SDEHIESNTDEVCGGSPRPINRPGLWRRRGVSQGIAQRLAGLWSAAFDHAPAIVVVDESDGGVVFGVLGVECAAYFIHRRPSPLKINIGRGSAFVDSCYRQ